jgi:hypothetical protein
MRERRSRRGSWDQRARRINGAKYNSRTIYGEDLDRITAVDAFPL